MLKMQFADQDELCFNIFMKIQFIYISTKFIQQAFD